MNPTGRFQGQNLWVKFQSHAEKLKILWLPNIFFKKTKTWKVIFPFSNFAFSMLIAI